MIVSVIIPAYNCESLVSHAINSILTQTYNDLEILVADDGSTDGTRSVIDSFVDSRIRAFHNDENVGYLKTVNHLLDKATGDFICFQDADDWSASSRIEKQLAVVCSRSVGACGTGIYYADLKGGLLKRVVYPSTTKNVRISMLEGRPSACYASILFSKEILSCIGGYREFFSSGAEDVDWLFRLVEQYEFTNLPEPLYFYRFSPSSITQSTSILKQKASLQVAREMALQREAAQGDYLQTGNAEQLLGRWYEIYESLQNYPLAEDLHKINALLRRQAVWECAKVCWTLLRKKAPLRVKVEIIVSAVIKSILGMDRYQSLKDAFPKSPAAHHD